MPCLGGRSPASTGHCRRNLAHDGVGNYAVFDAQGRATYFQPLEPSPDTWHALLNDWDGTRLRFEGILRPC